MGAFGGCGNPLPSLEKDSVRTARGNCGKEKSLPSGTEQYHPHNDEKITTTTTGNYPHTSTITPSTP